MRPLSLRMAARRVAKSMAALAAVNGWSTEPVLGQRVVDRAPAQTHPHEHSRRRQLRSTATARRGRRLRSTTVSWPGAAHDHGVSPPMKTVPAAITTSPSRLRGHNAVTSAVGQPGTGRDRLGRPTRKTTAQRYIPGPPGRAGTPAGRLITRRGRRCRMGRSTGKFVAEMRSIMQRSGNAIRGWIVRDPAGSCCVVAALHSVPKNH